MKEIIVKTQAEFDAIKTDQDGYIFIEGGTEEQPIVIKTRFESAEIVVRGQAWADVGGSATIGHVGDNATIGYVRGSATIRDVYGSATIRGVYGSATIGYVYGSATIGHVGDNATIGHVGDNATIGDVGGSATIRYVYGSATIRYVGGSATIRYVGGSATIRYVRDNATIRDVYGSATITLYGEAMVSAYSAKSIICKGYNVVKIRKSDRKNVKLVMGKNATLVIVPDFKPTFDDFAARFPVEVKGKSAILYKAVHKRDGRYVSQYDSSFDYAVGAVKKAECSPSKTESCTTGMHVGDKGYALNFGAGWDDLALLECEVPTSKIVVAKDCDGKVRTSELTVLREVPKEEYYQ